MTTGLGLLITKSINTRTSRKIDLYNQRIFLARKYYSSVTVCAHNNCSPYPCRTLHWEKWKEYGKRYLKTWTIGFIKPQKTIAFLRVSTFLLYFFLLLTFSLMLCYCTKRNITCCLPSIFIFFIPYWFYHLKKNHFSTNKCMQSFRNSKSQVMLLHM